MKDHYKYYVNSSKGEVIAVCRYAGQNIRSIAKCHPDDEFNVERGKAIAKAKCEVKVGQIKVRNATNKYYVAAKAADEAQRRYNAMKQYYIDSVDFLDDAIMVLNKYKVD